MRTFTTLCIAVSLILSVNAATVGKRATSAPVNECVALIDKLNTKIEALTPSFAAYEEASSTKIPEAISGIQQDHEKLLDDSLTTIDALNSARNTCCTIAIDPTAEEDRKAVFGALENYSKAALASLSTLNSKAPTFDELGEPFLTTQDILYGLTEPTTNFHNCLVQRVPAADTTKAEESTAKVDTALKEVSKSFKVPTGASTAQ